MSESVEFTAHVTNYTDDAILVNIGLPKHVWIPRSVMDYEGYLAVGETIEIEVEEWFAIKEELI